MIKKDRSAYYKEYRTKNKEWMNQKIKESRHRRGINKDYQSVIKLTKEELKFRRTLCKKAYKASRLGDKVGWKLIQRVYEDNIKRYGTLTCYLCLLAIDFGKDNLEHKIPLGRGGKNIYENMEVSCFSCNRKKRMMTLDEYLKKVG